MDTYENLIEDPEPYINEPMDNEDERHEDIESSEPWKNHPFQSLIKKTL
jgi:hypothetical protein